MQKFVFILKFQLLQSLRKATGVMLKSTSVERILKEDSSLVTAEDVFMVDTTEPNIALNNFNFTETVESNPDAPLDSNNVFEWRLRKTREYENMLEILSNPRWVLLDRQFLYLTLINCEFFAEICSGKRTQPSLATPLIGINSIQYILDTFINLRFVVLKIWLKRIRVWRSGSITFWLSTKLANLTWII